MRPTRLPLILTLVGLLALPACQGSPPASRLVLAPAVQGERLQVTVRVPERRIAALAADVETLVLTVQAADGREYQQTLDRAAVAAGPGTMTFMGLAPGATLVSAAALGANHRVIGRGDRRLTLASGVAHHVELDLYLDPLDAAAPTYPTPTPTTATFEATIVDGPVLAGVAVPSPTPVPLLGRELVRGSETYFNNADRQLAADSQGYVWVMADQGLAKFAQDGAVVVWAPLPAIVRITADAEDNVWALGLNKLYKFSPQGKQLNVHAVPAGTSSRRLAVDGAGQVWLAESQQVLRLSPAGVLLDTITLGAESGAIAVDGASGVLWVTLPKQGQVARVSAQGALLGTLTVNQFSDRLTDVQVDRQGHAWIAEQMSGMVAKIAPDGTHLGHHATGHEVMQLTGDRDGNILASTGYDAMSPPSTTILSSAGKVVGRYPTGHAFDTVIDAAGHFWYIGGHDATYRLIKIGGW